MNWTIVGLGNPGTKYALTRHNVGFIVVDLLQSKFECSAWKKKLFSNATVSTGEYDGNILTFIKPETFMNLSGRAVQKYIKTKEDISRLIVIHDDVHLTMGTFKISISRGDGGHNGITSLHQVLKSKDFIRIRIGIAPNELSPLADQKIKLDEYVLGKLSISERDSLDKISNEIAISIQDIISMGLDFSMNKHNKK